MQHNCGVVVIGRNEAARLARCLRSAQAARHVLYVDSGSTDGSVALARSIGTSVLELDPNLPFTAARARNEGFGRLRTVAQDIRYVQFVDGDCELADGWLAAGLNFLDATPRAGAVCGRLRERDPGASVYNLLCDLEWDQPAGETRACGGIAIFRTKAFQDVAGFRSDLIAGEEADLCLRLRKSGWSVHRVAHDMAQHDAAMDRFGQWWKRSVRTGHSYAQSAQLHGAPPERYGVRESRSALFWGLAFPAAVCLTAFFWSAWAFAALSAYPLQIARLATRGRHSRRENLWRAFFLVLGKFPQAIGHAKFLWHRLTHTAPQLIEYK